jgi:dihydrofolate reductase
MGIGAHDQRKETEMGKIVVSENVSLDGVVQDPTGEEGFTHGGWFGQIKDRPEVGKLALDEALGAEALLLGRRSYEFFAARWPSRSGELADRLNSLPKYVVSSTLEDPGWNNATVLKGEAVSEVSKLKQELDGDIVVLASFQIVHTLMEHDLVDELRLKVFPSCSGPESGSSARPATRSPCASSRPGPSMTASPSSPTSASETHSGRPRRQYSEELTGDRRGLVASQWWYSAFCWVASGAVGRRLAAVIVPQSAL